MATDEGQGKGFVNVFEALGLPDADEMFVKAGLACEIQRIMDDRGLTQQQAAEMVGLSQPKLSNLLRGRFRGVSEFKMMECLTKLGCDVRIVVGAPDPSRKGRVAVEHPGRD